MRVLLTGASGLVGRALAEALARRHSVIGTYRAEAAPIEGCELVRLELEDAAGIPALFSRAGPELVIHAAAMARPDECESRPVEAHRVNVGATRAVARACRKAGAGLVYVSTDLVFDGIEPRSGAIEVRFAGARRPGPEGAVLSDAFVKALEGVGLFDQVRLVHTSSEPLLSGTAINFQLECLVTASGREKA